MKFGSVCSGIEAASVATKSLGWEAAWLAEVEPFPCAVLSQSLGAAAPENEPYWLTGKELANWRKAIKKNISGGTLRNIGDMTVLPGLIRSGQVEAPDVLVGGTPCQAFSVAGKRRGLEDLRGNLTLCFAEILNAIDDARAARSLPGAICVWENVPGVYSDKTNAFGCLLAELAGYADPIETESGKWPGNGEVVGPRRRVAWATLDAQFFGVPQRRRRCWLVAVPNAPACGDTVDWPDPSEILALGSCLRGDTPKGRKAGQGAAAAAGGGAETAVYRECAKSSNAMLSSNPHTGYMELSVHNTLDSTAGNAPGANQGGVFIVQAAAMAVPIDLRNALRDPEKHDDMNRQGTGVGQPGEPACTLSTATCHGVGVVLTTLAFDTTQCTSPGNYSNPKVNDPMHPLAAGAHVPCVAISIESGAALRHGVGVIPCWRDGGQVSQTLDAVLAKGQTMPEKNRFPAVISLAGDAAGAELGLDLGCCLKVGGAPQMVAIPTCGVRRLLPVECERLQGFPDGWTSVRWNGKPAPDCPDGGRYKALGNSWAVPVANWVFSRIDIALAGGKVNG